MEIEWSDNELASNTEVSLGYAIILVSIQCVKCAGIMVALKSKGHKYLNVITFKFQLVCRQNLKENLTNFKFLWNFINLQFF